MGTVLFTHFTNEILRSAPHCVFPRSWNIRNPPLSRLEELYPEVKCVNRLMTHNWGQKVVRFYDPDGNLIEVGTTM